MEVENGEGGAEKEGCKLRKITLQIDEKAAKLIAETYNVDVEKLINNMVNAMIDMIKEAIILRKTSVPINMGKIDAMGKEIGRSIFRDSINKDKETKK